ncbi:hypothetical protein AAF712_013372 [Marasmius tenuissimus]|uniref:DUF8191 domain-containing protein n=1 Tax=Marasmius tenuissimus TaxID=585030 RepID=A0ABR2ZDT0_9AGAR
MDREKSLLKGIILTQKQTIENLERESNQLRAALRVFTDESSTTKRGGDETVYYEASEDTDIEKLVESLNLSDSVELIGATPGQSNSEASQGDDNEEDVDVSASADDEEEEDGIAPIWSKEDDIYRCALCNWEIVEAECQGCWYDYSNYDCEFDPIYGDNLDHSDTTFHLLNDDYLLPLERSTTPLISVNPARLRADTVAYGYEHRLNEYESLLSRGATRPMCEMFSLSFSPETGITLDMTENDDLFDSWAGEAILAKECHSWTVSLGREIRLDPDDIDGSDYIEDFLEEALLYSTGRLEDPGSLFWVTKEVSWGHWDTRAVVSTGIEEGEGEQERPADIAEPSLPIPNDAQGLSGDNNEVPNDPAEANQNNKDDVDDDDIPLRVGKDEYESDGMDDESIAPTSEESEGFESEREDKFWGHEEGGYKYNSESEELEDVEEE